MHDINLRFFMHFYTDVFGFGAGLVITQFRDSKIVDVMNIKAVKVSIIYDSFTFAFIKRKYLIYKRELYVMIMFIIKYDYLYKHSYLSIIIHIDHKSLTHFLSSDLYEEIYDH